MEKIVEEFIGFLVPLALVGGLTGLLAIKRLRTRWGFLLLGIVNAVFLARWDLFPLLGLFLLVFWLGKRLSEKENIDYSLSAVGVVVLLAYGAAYLFFRQRFWSNEAGWPSTLALLLQMHISLRLFSFIWDCASGLTTKVSLSHFFAWNFFPLTFYGPIIRYSSFSESYSRLEEGTFSGRFSRLNGRLLLIALFQLWIAAVFAYIENRWFVPGAPLIHKLACWFFFIPWKIFCTYAGVWHIYEALSGIWGVPVPVNFNRPLLRTNLGDFWSHWNVSVTSLFRDIFFYNRWGFNSFPLVASSVVTFVAVGAWHGLGWIPWGLYNGIGFAVFLLYREWRVRYFGPTAQFPRWYSAACFLATYLFVCSTYFIPGKLAIMGYALVQGLIQHFV